MPGGGRSWSLSAYKLLAPRLRSRSALAFPQEGARAAARGGHGRSQRKFGWYLRPGFRRGAWSSAWRVLSELSPSAGALVGHPPHPPGRGGSRTRVGTQKGGRPRPALTLFDVAFPFWGRAWSSLLKRRPPHPPSPSPP